jgi:hypothetical protein
MSVSGIFTQRVRGFRVVEVVALGLLAVTILGVYLAKTMAGSERARIAALESSIADEKARIRLLDAEVAYLERPRRVSRLAETYLGLKPVDAKREATVETLAVVAATPVSLPKPAAAPQPAASQAAAPQAVTQ